jgi:hypothetical protein
MEFVIVLMVIVFALGAISGGLTGYTEETK